MSTVHHYFPTVRHQAWWYVAAALAATLVAVLLALVIATPGTTTSPGSPVRVPAPNSRIAERELNPSFPHVHTRCFANHAGATNIELVHALCTAPGA